MKRDWELHELIEQWTLIPRELELLRNKTGATRLGCAVSLKFFQQTAQFPQKLRDVPKPVLQHLAQQVNVAAKEFCNYLPHSRAAKYHRQQIREFCGFRSPTTQDAQDLQQWLSQTILPQCYDQSLLEQQAVEHLRELRIEPLSSGRLQRVIRAAIRQHEREFCQTITDRLSATTRRRIDQLLTQACEAAIPDEAENLEELPLQHLATEPSGTGLLHLFKEAEKLKLIRQLDLPLDLFTDRSAKVVTQYRRRATTERQVELRRHPAPVRYTLLSAFCWQRGQEITDNLVDILLGIIHKLSSKAEYRVTQQLTQEFKRVEGKTQLLYQIAQAALARPEGTVQEVIYPVAAPDVLQSLVEEFTSNGVTYRQRVHKVLRRSYLYHYRRMLPQLLELLEFRSNNTSYQPIIDSLALLKKYTSSPRRYFPPEENLPLEALLRSGWRDILLESASTGEPTIERVNFEIVVLQALRSGLRCKEIWVVGANRYRNPEQDLPGDFDDQRVSYYQALQQPMDVEVLINGLQQQMKQALSSLNNTLPSNVKVKLLDKQNGWIHLSPLAAQTEPRNLVRLKSALVERWPMTSLLDMLKEADLRIGFTDCSAATRESLTAGVLQKRLLLCLYALGTNTGLKRVSAATPEISRDELRYVRRRFIQPELLRQAIVQVVNATLQVRHPQWWGEGTVACASDSKQFGAWEQNLTSEYHTRYGGRGVMVYWHVEKKSACIYSQLKTVSSSEVAAMITGVLRHNTEMEVQKNYVDTHGQSEIGFAFSHLLGFELLPRLKNIHAQKLYRPEVGMAEAYPNLQLILTRPIRWELIRQQYDQMVKYATALRLGIAQPEAILSRFRRGNPQHPTYQALAELGKVVKTLFLCRYLESESLRQEIHQGLNVVENWNSANSFIFYGKSGEIASNNRAEQEIALLSLHLLQMCVVYVNTLMIQQVLSAPQWQQLLQPEDLRGMTPLIYGHINPYGTFLLDLSKRLNLEQVA
jgi:TnpA family transposase